jgi:hypothetical protein
VNSFQQLCAAVVLTLSFIVPVFAGEMQTPGTPTSDDSQTSSSIAGPVMDFAFGYWLNVASLL